MGRWKRWLVYLVVLFLIIGLGYLLLGLIFTETLVDAWWLQTLGYANYFWLRLNYSYMVFGVFLLLFSLVFFLNFWIASRFLGSVPPPEPRTDKARYRQQLVTHFRTGSLKVYTPFSLLLGMVVAFPLYKQWESTLLYIFAPAAGVLDPLFGKDISYYLFSLPVYLLIFNELLIALGLLFFGLLLLYCLERRLLARQELQLPQGAKIHLSILVGLVFCVGGWFFMLQRHSLLYTSTHAKLFFGPGFVEVWVVLPLIWLSIILLAAFAGLLIFYLNTRQRLRVLGVVAVLFLLTLSARHSSFLLDQVQAYIVKPNEIALEKNFIGHNIQATLAAYNLNRIETREYPIGEGSRELKSPQLEIGLRNIPVWDRNVLQEVYDQLQAMRAYYQFISVDVDRYVVNGLYRQVYLSPRELNLAKLPPGARNWVNERLKYTHGYGVVMTPAAQSGEQSFNWFIQGIPPTSDVGFKIEQTAIYYGMGHYGPVIAPNDSREIDYPTETGFAEVDYQGQGDVRLSSLFRKLIFALYFKEKDFFFTTSVGPRSKILFRRQIEERVKTLTPFFRLDQDPYIVVTPKGLFWILDGYTTSNNYPYAQLYNNDFNYIRNSVKIVVDAYHGSVDYYLADELDPIIRAYSRMYPGLIKSLDRMPPELKSHLRYPKDLFDIQMSIYANYHQTDPEIFYKQEDLWEFPKIQQDNQTVRMLPYYMMLNLPDPQQFEFNLICPLTPKTRGNLSALVAAGCDGANYGKIVVHSFPKGTLVLGPSQVDAFINQDTAIAEQFTLWNQKGSRVERGRMVLLPVDDSIIYIQPVYLKAETQLKIPQLKRLIISKGETVVMEDSLEGGFAKLQERLKSKIEGVKHGH